MSGITTTQTVCLAKAAHVASISLEHAWTNRRLRQCLIISYSTNGPCRAKKAITRILGDDTMLSPDIPEVLPAETVKVPKQVRVALVLWQFVLLPALRGLRDEDLKPLLA